MRPFFLYVLLLSFSLKAQEIQPTWAIRYSPLHLAYQDPTVQFQFEKFVTPQNSWTVSLGLGQQAIFKHRDIQGTFQGKVGYKKYFQLFSSTKKNNFFWGIEGMYKNSVEYQTAFDRNTVNGIEEYKLRINVLAGHAMVGWTLMNPEAPSLDVYLGLGLRHARNRNQGLDSTQPFDRPLTSFNRSEGNFTHLSPLLGICIGIGRWKK